MPFLSAFGSIYLQPMMYGCFQNVFIYGLMRSDFLLQFSHDSDRNIHKEMRCVAFCVCVCVRVCVRVCACVTER